MLSYTELHQRRSQHDASAVSEARSGWADGQADRLLALEERVSEQQRSIDRLGDGVADVADRAEAATRLAELQQMHMQPLQRVAEQREADVRVTSGLKEELRAVQARGQRHDDLLARLRDELAALAPLAHQHKALHDAVAATQQDQERCYDAVQALRDEQRDLLRQLQELQSEARRRSDDVQQEARAAAAAAAAQAAQSLDTLRQQMREELNAVQGRCEARVEAAERRAQQAAQEARRLAEELRELRQVVQQQALQVGGAEAERRRHSEHAAQVAGEALRVGTEELRMRLAEAERRQEALRSDFAEHVAAYRAHLHQQTATSEETAAAVQRMMTAADEGRRSVAEDLSGVRDWAVRNMQRLKKRIELSAQELRQLQDGHSALSEAQQRQAAAAEREQRLLRELLRQQTEKAGLLAEMVDRQLDDAVGRRRSPTPQLQHAAAAAAAAAAGALRATGGESPRISPRPRSRRGRKSDRAGQMQMLLDDLAFHDRHR
eukprot:TRINITY_DN6524_c1_g1_i1.p1 TRINITY_DN6524_c1_g1~~TRINITY_DN6524_c1_g1_i1.p1  ORF type:complete len:493 (+),score=233.72 TRINITY_DN6524_c1_g1_i1:71-1549(+)